MSKKKDKKPVTAEILQDEQLDHVVGGVQIDHNHLTTGDMIGVQIDHNHLTTGSEIAVQIDHNHMPIKGSLF